MENVIRENNETKYFMDEDLLLTIVELENNCFVTENKEYRIKGKIKIVNSNCTEIEIIEHKRKDKRGSWRKSKRLLGHNTSWFLHILEEKGFIEKRTPVV